MTSNTADDFFRGGTPSAKFPTPGTTVAGRIVSIGEQRQAKDFATGTPRHWDNGDPVMQLPIEVATDQRDPDVPDDDGTRTLWVQQGTLMQKAIGAALRAAGAKLAVGGHLSVTYTGDGTAKQKGFNPPKLYEATYEPPAPGGSFFDAQGPAAEREQPTAGQQPAPAAARSAASGPVPGEVETAKSLIAIGQPDDVIARACPSLTPEVIAALRNAA